MFLKKETKFLLLTASVAFVGILGVSSLSYAGFEWKAPTSRTVSEDPQFPNKVDWLTNVEWKADKAASHSEKNMSAQPNHDMMGGSVPQPITSFDPNAVSTPSSQWWEKRASADGQVGSVVDQILLEDAHLPYNSEIIEGFGQDIPLVVALSQIVPTEYQFSFAEGIDQRQEVSWQGGKTWTSILEDVLGVADLSFNISADNVVDVVHAKSGMVQDHAEMNMSGPVFSAPAVMDEPMTTSSLEIETQVQVGWMAHAGDDLKDVLEMWSKKAGVNVYWSIDSDYQIGGDIALSGSYEKAVEDLLNKFHEADPRPYGKLHVSSDGPKVLIVKANSKKT